MQMMTKLQPIFQSKSARCLNVFVVGWLAVVFLNFWFAAPSFSTFNVQVDVNCSVHYLLKTFEAATRL